LLVAVLAKPQLLGLVIPELELEMDRELVMPKLALELGLKVLVLLGVVVLPPTLRRYSMLQLQLCQLLPDLRQYHGLLLD